MMLISSLQRSGYEGKVLLFTNSEAQPFRLGRCKVEQVRLELADSSQPNDAYRMKYLISSELPAAALAESPIYRGGEQLQPWQRSFLTIFLQHRETYGNAAANTRLKSVPSNR